MSALVGLGDHLGLAGRGTELGDAVPQLGIGLGELAHRTQHDPERGGRVGTLLTVHVGEACVERAAFAFVLGSLKQQLDGLRLLVERSGRFVFDLEVLGGGEGMLRIALQLF